MKKIFKDIVSKSMYKPVLRTVYLTERKQVATDAYSLLEVDVQALDGDAQIKHSELMEGKEHAFIDIKTEKIDHVIQNSEESYPQYNQIIPTQEDLENDKKYISIKLTPLYLAQLAKAINETYKKKEVQSINLYVPVVKNKPLVIQRTDKLAIGLLMPQSEY